jgi:hypothetical protein
MVNRRDPPVMQDAELYEKLLGLSAPWSVQEVDLQVKVMKVSLKLSHLFPGLTARNTEFAKPTSRKLSQADGSTPCLRR